MKAYELHPNEGFASLTLVDRAVPGALGAHDVRVRIRATSLNYRDLVIARGAKTRSKRVVPVSDGAGEVLEVGAQVTRVRVGDRVAGSFFPTWVDGHIDATHHANALGGSIDGVLAEQVVLPDTGVVVLPEYLSFEQGATLPCAGLTAWHALHEATQVRSGDTVLVQGTGGVSIFALQLARLAGARVVATTSSPGKAARLTELGAAAVVDYKQTPEWGEPVRKAAGGDGVDIAVEVGGAGTFDQSVKALRFGGALSLIGVLTGTQAQINTHAIVHKSLHVNGVYVGSLAMFERFTRALEATRLVPLVDKVFPFAEARAAYDYLASGAHFGKVIVRVD
ncbi:MAG: NAD(P)-dependent alcohol dehydrogenase [Kofleriaceae bacterium]